MRACVARGVEEEQRGVVIHKRTRQNSVDFIGSLLELLTQGSPLIYILLVVIYFTDVSHTCALSPVFPFLWHLSMGSLTEPLSICEKPHEIAPRVDPPPPPTTPSPQKLPVNPLSIPVAFPLFCSARNDGINSFCITVFGSRYHDVLLFLWYQYG